MNIVLKKSPSVHYKLPSNSEIIPIEKNDKRIDNNEELVNTKEVFLGEKCENNVISRNTSPNKVIICVKDKTFVLDKDFLANVSPLFKIIINSSCTIKSKCCIEKEIVDEKPSDIDIFIKCLEEPKNITYDNVALIMRLGTKYVIPSLKESCSNFIRNIDIKEMSLPVIVEFLKNCLKSMTFDRRFEKLILRIAMEDSIKIQGLKLTHIHHKLYGSVMATHFNVLYMKAVENMNGHFFNLEKNKIKYNKYICKGCNKIADVVFCVGCKKDLCENHWRGKRCENNYGSLELRKIKENLVDISKDC
uniref:BTB domain-containing protein n=1 Tax=Strongyloides venezuelensis TaxID=75913 RepID=A0A0K0G4I9_STRVS